MARVQKVDRGLSAQLDEFESRVFLLKINYDKYFSGLDAIEPIRDRDALRRMLRDLLQQPVRNTRQRFRLQNLKARFNTMELFWQRNLAMIERGIHPKQRFRADKREQSRMDEEARAAQAAVDRAVAGGAGHDERDDDDGEGSEMSATRPITSRRPSAARPAAEAHQSREAQAYRQVYDRFIEARASCGQSTNLPYESIRETLRKQVDAIKSSTQCSSVRFRVVVEEGKAKVKAIPKA